MQANLALSNGKLIGQGLMGLATLLLVAAVLTGVKLPFIRSDRAALVALTLVGMAFCGLGMKIDLYGWLNPITLVGCVLGTLMLGMVIAVFAGVRLPFIPDARAAFVALAALMALKVGLDVLRAVLFHK